MSRIEPTDGEYRRIHALCRDCGELRHDPELMHQTLVDGLAELIGAERGMSLVAEQGPTPTINHWGGVRGRFSWEARDLARFVGFINRGPLLADGGFDFAHRVLAQHPTVAGCRRSIWTDGDWDAGISRREQKGMERVEDVLFAAFKGAWQGGPEIVVGVCLHRLRNGIRRPFDEHDLRLLKVFIEWRQDAGCGSLGEFSWRKPLSIELTPSQRFCYHRWLEGATQQEIASGLESQALERGLVDRSRVWRRLSEVAANFGVGCPNDLRYLARPLRSTDATKS